MSLLKQEEDETHPTSEDDWKDITTSEFNPTGDHSQPLGADGRIDINDDTATDKQKSTKPVAPVDTAPVMTEPAEGAVTDEVATITTTTTATVVVTEEGGKKDSIDESTPKKNQMPPTGSSRRSARPRTESHELDGHIGSWEGGDATMETETPNKTPTTGASREILTLEDENLSGTSRVGKKPTLQSQQPLRHGDDMDDIKMETTETFVDEWHGVSDVVIDDGEAVEAAPASSSSPSPSSRVKKRKHSNGNVTCTNKKAAATTKDDTVDGEGTTNKKPRKSNHTFPPPKKLNREQWDQMFERLVAYQAKHGDCRVPKRYSPDPKLGTWVETQRVQYKRLKRAARNGSDKKAGTEPGKDDTNDDDDSGGESASSSGVPLTPSKRLNSERLKRLETIGFAWSAKNKKRPPSSFRTPARRRFNDEQWNEMYERLKKYKEKYGDCNVPKKFDGDPKLATWVETQRVMYNRDKRSKDRSSSVCGSTNDDELVEDDGVSSRPSKGGESEGEKSSPTNSGGKKSTVDVDRTITDATGDTIDQVVTNLMASAKAKGEDAITNSAAKGKSPEEWADEIEQETTGMTKGALGTSTPPPTPASSVTEMNNGTSNAGIPVQIMGMNDAKRDPVEKSGVKGEGREEDTSTIGSSSRKEPSKTLTKERKEKLEAIGFVWSLRAKRVEDHWDEMFQQLLEYKAKHGDCLVPSRYEENTKLGKWVETQRYEHTKLKRASEHLDKESIEAAGGDPVAAAAAFAVTPGKKCPKGLSGKLPHSASLRLNEERLRRLEAVGFEWRVKNKMKRYYDKQWNAMFKKLVKYKEKNGNCLVPKRYPPDMKLGTWVHTQRIQYRKLMAGTAKKEEGDDTTEDDEVSFRLTEERKIRLESIGFAWSAREKEPTKQAEGGLTRNSYDDQWDAMFERLKRYKERHGNCLVPKRCKVDPKLGTWVDTQRVQYKKMKRQLEKRGFKLSGTTPIKVEQDAEDKSASSGEGQPDEAAEKLPSPGKPLIGRLTDERIKRLEDLGFVWSLRDDWQKHYRELIEFKKKQGHCNVPARYPENRRLGIWVSAQRQQYKLMTSFEEGDTKLPKSSPLTEERIRLLNEIGFKWTIRSRDSLGESWNQRLEDLRAYKMEHGNTLVPSRYPPNPELGVWVGTQRTQYRLYIRAKEEGIVCEDDTLANSTSMNEERIAQLEELGFVWALRGSSDNLWKKRLNELAQYKIANGDCTVPAKYKPNPRLGTWVANQKTQRRLFEEGKPSSLDEGKIAELNALGFFCGSSGEIAGEAFSPGNQAVTVTAGVTNGMSFVSAPPNTAEGTVQVAAQWATASASPAAAPGALEMNSEMGAAAASPNIPMDPDTVVGTPTAAGEINTTPPRVDPMQVEVGVVAGLAPAPITYGSPVEVQPSAGQIVQSTITEPLDTTYHAAAAAVMHHGGNVVSESVGTDHIGDNFVAGSVATDSGQHEVDAESVIASLVNMPIGGTAFVSAGSENIVAMGGTGHVSVSGDVAAAGRETDSHPSSASVTVCDGGTGPTSVNGHENPSGVVTEPIAVTITEHASMPMSAVPESVMGTSSHVEGWEHSFNTVNSGMSTDTGESAPGHGSSLSAT